MMVKSGLEEIFLTFLHVGNYFPLIHKREDFLSKTKYSVTKNRYFIFVLEMVISGTDCILRVETMVV